jgi:hypothetical protein
MSATGRRDSSKGKKRGRRAGRIGLVAMALAAAWALIAAVAANATTVTVGSVLPPTFTSTPFEGVRTQFNTALPEAGAKIASPVNGAIIRWKLQGAKGGPFTLRVLHPSGGGSFTASGTSAPAMPIGLGIETFATSLPIRNGDLIAVDSANGTDEIGVATVTGASYGIFSQPPFEGATNAASLTVTGKEIELAAEVQPAPAITSVTADEGSVLGGEKVTISGTNFEGASSLTFGEIHAKKFTVVNEETITAVVPAQKQVGRVDVVATTLAGSSPTNHGSEYAYRGCTVPDLTGRRFKQAKRLLHAGDCTLGKVSKVLVSKKKKGKVVKQSVKAGRALAVGAKVNIKLGRVVEPKAPAKK